MCCTTKASDCNSTVADCVHMLKTQKTSFLQFSVLLPEPVVACYFAGSSQVAARLDYDVASPSRGMAALLHVLYEAAAKDGDTYLTWGVLHARKFHVFWAKTILGCCNIMSIMRRHASVVCAGMQP